MEGKYVRIGPDDVEELKITIPVVFRIGEKEFTGLLHGLVRADDTHELEPDESVAER